MLVTFVFELWKSSSKLGTGNASGEAGEFMESSSYDLTRHLNSLIGVSRGASLMLEGLAVDTGERKVSRTLGCEPGLDN